MECTTRRNLVRTLGALLPAAPLLAASEAQAQTTGSKGAIDEAHAQEIIAGVKPAVALLEMEQHGGMSWGSGFFVSSDGLLVTNRRVVKGAQKITCLYKNKTKLPAVLLKEDAQYDLAVVKVEVPQAVPTVTLGDSESLSEGVLVAVTGYPGTKWMVWWGMAVDSSTSRGAINGLRFGGDVNTYYGDRVLQIDAPITVGNSGGPVIRLDTGEVVGVVVDGGGNMTFAVPVNQAKVLVAGIGGRLKPNPVTAGTREAVIEPGDLRVLNTVSVSKELPRLFAVPFEFERRFVPNQQPVNDWAFATGQRPADVTPFALEGDDLFFGATDGKLRQWRLDRMYEEPYVIMDAGEENVILHAPVVTRNVIVCATGALDLNQRLVQKTTVFSVIRLFSGLGGGGSETKVITRIEGQGQLVGLNRDNGNIDWTVDTGWVGTPSLHENKIYYGGMGERGCVDAIQGKQIWKVEVKKGPQAEFFHIGHAGPSGVIAMAVPVEGKRADSGPLSILGDGKLRVEKYEAGTGKLIWKTEIGDIKEDPRVIGTAMFVDQAKGITYALCGQVVAAVEVGSGKRVWVYDHGKAMLEAAKKNKDKKNVPIVNFSPQMAMHDGIIYIGSEDRKLYAFNGQDGQQLWTYNTRGNVGQPFYYEGQVLVGSSDGYIHAVDAKSGTLAWRVLTRGAVTSQPFVRQGMVFAATRDGQVMTVRIPLA